MSFGLSPREHFDCFLAERDAFRADITNIRTGVNCCVWANHLPEIIYSEYATSSPSKINGPTSGADYRNQMILMHPDLGIIRDLCDYAKHGPRLSRSTVRVTKTEKQGTLEVSSVWMMMGIPHHEEVDRLVVTLKSGGERWLDAVVEGAAGFWEQQFSAAGL